MKALRGLDFLEFSEQQIKRHAKDNPHVNYEIENLNSHFSSLKSENHVHKPQTKNSRTKHSCQDNSCHTKISLSVIVHFRAKTKDKKHPHKIEKAKSKAIKPKSHKPHFNSFLSWTNNIIPNKKNFVTKFLNS